MAKAFMTTLAAAAFGSALALTGTSGASAETVRAAGAAAAPQVGEPLASYAQFRRGHRTRVGRGGYYGRPYHYGHRGSGAGVAAGMIGGLAAGAIIGGAIASQQAQAMPGTVYVQPGYAQPGSDAVAYCMQRYRSYDPQSGTFLGYDGMRHACP
jgi:hypothetical protein